jgi:hypothetical protein
VADGVGDAEVDGESVADSDAVAVSDGVGESLDEGAAFAAVYSAAVALAISGEAVTSDDSVGSGVGVPLVMMLVDDMGGTSGLTMATICCS